MPAKCPPAEHAAAALIQTKTVFLAVSRTPRPEFVEATPPAVDQAVAERAVRALQGGQMPEFERRRLRVASC